MSIFRDEFDFIPVLEPENNCNPIILENHKLGIEIWSAKLLFMYAYAELLNTKSRSNYRTSGKYSDVVQRMKLKSYFYNAFH